MTPCAVCGAPVDPAAAVGVGMPPELVHVEPCFAKWLATAFAPLRAWRCLNGELDRRKREP